MSITVLSYIHEPLMEKQKAAIESVKQQKTQPKFEQVLTEASQTLSEQLPVNTVTVTPAVVVAPVPTTPSSSDYFNCSDELNSIFDEAASTYHVDVNLLKSIAMAESDFDPNCTSSSGAMGIMQLMPETAQSLGVQNAYDVRENIMGGSKLISQLLDKYQQNAALALAAYNAGSGSVDRYGGIPPFTETMNYVPKVLGFYHNATASHASSASIEEMLDQILNKIKETQN